MKRLAALAVAVLLAGLAWMAVRTHPLSGAAGTAPAAVAADFVGSDGCRTCHAVEYTAWAGSQHARAMQHASEQTVRGDFADATFSFDGVTSRFFRRDGRFVVRTDGSGARGRITACARRLAPRPPAQRQARQIEGGNAYRINGLGGWPRAEAPGGCR